MVHFAVAGIWQGSGSSRAMRLSDGAEAIRADLPASSTRVVDTPPGAGTDIDTGVPRASALASARDTLRVALDQIAGPVITVGGSASADMGGLEHALARSGPGLGLLWFGARDGLRAPALSMDGADASLLSFWLGNGPDVLTPREPLEPGHVLLVGARDGDEDSEPRPDVARLGAQSSADEIVAAAAALGAESLYVHIELDVLDPAEFTAVSEIAPFGLSLATLTEALRSLPAAAPVVGGSLTGFAPAGPDDVTDAMGTVLRVIGALTAACRAGEDAS